MSPGRQARFPRTSCWRSSWPCCSAPPFRRAICWCRRTACRKSCPAPARGRSCIIMAPATTGTTGLRRRPAPSPWLRRRICPARRRCRRRRPPSSPVRGRSGRNRARRGSARSFPRPRPGRLSPESAGGRAPLRRIRETQGNVVRSRAPRAASAVPGFGRAGGTAGGRRRYRPADHRHRCAARRHARDQRGARRRADRRDASTRSMSRTRCAICPSLLVRKRHIGDTQAPLATRTSGVGASARSLIYADGVLLSALIGNNNSFASPRWGMVSPEEIERIDVLYGPFSAAYPGNSIGAVVNITTRLPDQPDRLARASATERPALRPIWRRTATSGRPAGGDAGATGPGRFAWFVSANHVDSRSQPLAYVTVARPAGAERGRHAGDRRLRRPQPRPARRSSCSAPAGSSDQRAGQSRRSSSRSTSARTLRLSYRGGALPQRHRRRRGDLSARRGRRAGLCRHAQHRRAAGQRPGQRLLQQCLHARRAPLDARADASKAARSASTGARSARSTISTRTCSASPRARCRRRPSGGRRLDRRGSTAPAGGRSIWRAAPWRRRRGARSQLRRA